MNETVNHIKCDSWTFNRHNKMSHFVSKLSEKHWNVTSPELPTKYVSFNWLWPICLENNGIDIHVYVLRMRIHAQDDFEGLVAKGKYVIQLYSTYSVFPDTIIEIAEQKKMEQNKHIKYTAIAKQISQTRLLPTTPEKNEINVKL